MKSKSLCLVALLLVGAMVLKAQVTGTVVEATSGFGAIGASVLEAGTTNGTATDFDGAFTLNVAEGTMLEISYIGFKSQTVAAKDGMVVRLEEDNAMLDEVVVVGYGSQKKKEVTGSVASVKAEDFNAGVQSSPVGLLQGKVAGLNISRSTADPTSTGYDIQIRGFSTLDKGAGTSPLFIVDGVPVSNIDNLAPNEIASMDVLKDGSAAAIYGTRGTNGVILITTKRGAGFSEQATTTLEYDGYVSVAWNNTRTGMATAEEFRKLGEYTNGTLTGKDRGYSTDWLGALTRTAAITHNHNISISGAHKNFSYRGAVNFKNAEGIAKKTNRQEVMAKFAADQKVLDGWLQFQYDFSYMHYRNDYFCGDFTQAAILNPTAPIYDENTSTGYFTPSEYGLTGQSNPVEAMNQKESYQDGNYFRGSVRATVNIKSVEGLKVSGFAALEEGDNHNYWANDELAGNPSESGKAGRGSNTNFNQLYEGTIDYAHNWGGHSLVMVGGFTYQHFMNDWCNFENKGFATNNMKYYKIFDGDPEKTYLMGSGDNPCGRSSHTLAAAFLRVNYNFNEKYLISASLRAEGSSRFGANNKWGYFPAVSAGWRIKGESFMRDQKWCNDLKLRAGFGMTGNDLNDDLKSVALLDPGDVIQFNGTLINTYKVKQNVNPDLKWEKKYEYNIGLDFSFLDNRLYGSLDGYYRQTKDLLWEYEVPTPPYQYNTLLANAGEMESYGVELALSGVPVKRGNWTWTSTLTLAWNDNRITKLSDEAKGFNYKETTSGGVSGTHFNNVNTQLLREGESVGSFYGYKFIGFQSNGTWVYEDRFGDPTTNPQDADRQVLGNAQPKVTYGWNNTVRWKNLDITLFLRGVIGNKILNFTRWHNTPEGPVASRDYNVFVYDLKGNNGADKNGGAVYADINNFSDYWLEDGSYLKCDNLTVGYTFPFKDNKYIRSIRLTATGQNLFRITAYSGQDPEVSTTNVWSAGIDYESFYPKTASCMVGLNINLK